MIWHFIYLHCWKNCVFEVLCFLIVSWLIITNLLQDQWASQCNVLWSLTSYRNFLCSRLINWKLGLVLIFLLFLVWWASSSFIILYILACLSSAISSMIVVEERYWSHGFLCLMLHLRGKWTRERSVLSLIFSMWFRLTHFIRYI